MVAESERVVRPGGQPADDQLRDLIAQALADSHLLPIAANGFSVRAFSATSELALTYATAAVSAVSPLLASKDAEIERLRSEHDDGCVRAVDLLAGSLRERVRERDEARSQLVELHRVADRLERDLASTDEGLSESVAVSNRRCGWIKRLVSVALGSFDAGRGEGVQVEAAIARIVDLVGDSTAPDRRDTTRYSLTAQCECGHVLNWHRVGLGCTADHCPCRDFVAKVDRRVARVWQKGDPEPADRPKVRDCQGDVWSFVGFGRDGNSSWSTPETMPCTWEHIAKKWAPLTEVLEGGDSNG